MKIAHPKEQYIHTLHIRSQKPLRKSSVVNSAAQSCFAMRRELGLGGTYSTTIRGCQRCNFVLQSALNCLNLKWQLVKHVG